MDHSNNEQEYGDMDKEDIEFHEKLMRAQLK